MEKDFNYTPKKLEDIALSGTPVFGELEKNIIYTFSGKSALTMLLRYYRSTGQLRDRTEQVLVPEWLGTPVYSIMQKYSFPSTVFHTKIRGVMAYHQWGFPQDMETLMNFCAEHKLFLIEDCAHSFESYYKGRRLGTFGDTAFFSLSKFFPSVVGGAVYATRDTIKEFLRSVQNKDNRELSQKIFAHCFTMDNHPTEENHIDLIRNYQVYDKVLHCPDYSLAVAQREIAHNTLERRKKNYEQFKNAFASMPYFSTLIEDDVLPWAVPLFFDEATCTKVANIVRENGINTDVYHFDVNRNMLNPHFVACVLMPCHQGLDEEYIEKSITLIKKAIL